MLFHNFLTLIPALLSLGANAAALPTPVLDNDLVPRCDTCTSGPGVGPGVGSSIQTSADVNAALQVFTFDQFSFASGVTDVFAHATGDVKGQVNSVLTIGTGILDWTTADVTELSVALDAFIAGTISTGVSIFAKAVIDVAVFTTTEAAYLKAFVTTCVRSDVQLTAEVKADIVLFVKNAIVVANTTCADLQARIKNNVSVLVSVVNSLHLDAKVSTCASAAQAIKLALKTYIQSCISSTTGPTAAITKVTLTTLLQIVNAWIANDFGILTGAAVTLLGIDLKAASDAAICKAIVAFLLGINAKFNFATAYGLDGALYAKVFSVVVGR